MKRYNIPITRVLSGILLFNVLPLITGFIESITPDKKTHVILGFRHGYIDGWIFTAAAFVLILLVVGIVWLIQHTFKFS